MLTDYGCKPPQRVRLPCPPPWKVPLNGRQPASNTGVRHAQGFDSSTFRHKGVIMKKWLLEEFYVYPRFVYLVWMLSMLVLIVHELC